MGSPAAHFTRAVRAVLTDGRKRDPLWGRPPRTLLARYGPVFRWTETGGRPPRTLLARYGPVLQITPYEVAAAHFTRYGPVLQTETGGRPPRTERSYATETGGRPPRTLLARYGPVLQMDGNATPCGVARRALYSCGTGRSYRWTETRPPMGWPPRTLLARYGPVLQMDGNATPYGVARRALYSRRYRWTETRPPMGSPGPVLEGNATPYGVARRALYFARYGPVLRGNATPYGVARRVLAPPETGGRPPRTLLARYGPVLQMDGNRGSPAAHFTRAVRARLTDGRNATLYGFARRKLYSRGGRSYTKTRPPMGSPAAHFTRAVRAGLTDGRKHDPLWGRPPRTLLARYGPFLQMEGNATPYGVARYSRRPAYRWKKTRPPLYSRGTGRSYRWTETGGRPPRTLLARYGPVLQMRRKHDPLWGRPPRTLLAP